jgi:class 3 adenylate cyclase/tetratricopeptide (TPR) repeat protein
MKCPKCQTDNPDHRKFCRQCGAKLSILCPQCAAENISGDKFCGECGSILVIYSKPEPKSLSFDDKLKKIQRYLPQGLAEKILAQKGRIEGERRQVTVMFCDMAGFTKLSEKLGPEIAYSIMDKVYEILIHKVHDYEGTVNELTGDGIMALFGAPVAMEDAPQRAIRSSLAIHREMSRLTDLLKQENENIPPVKMRIGIHSGPVVVGTLGNDLRVDFKAVGDTVNLASRMEGIAEPGATYVTDETHKLTEGFFRFEALGEKKVKGKDKPIVAYRVIAPSSRRTRFDVSAEIGLTPLIGRERELEILSDTFARAKEGRGQVFSIVSEAGLGKSRLLYEFRKAVSNEDIIFLEGKCLSYSKGVAYHPIIDILKASFKIKAEDEGNRARAKVQSTLKTLDITDTDSLSTLLDFLSVQDSGINKSILSPEAKRDRIINTLIRIIIKYSEIKPLVLAIEDLHWIDQSTEDYLKFLMESISGARVLLIFTYRPEFSPSWKSKSYHRQINLNLFSNQQSIEMVRNLLDADRIDAHLKDLILEKTEGVPFFIEEFVRSLKAIKIIEKIGNQYHLATLDQGLSVPSTIQEIIMARVDALPEGAKELLQIGSVIEREFSCDLIGKVTDLHEDELFSTINVLKDFELIYERGLFPKSVIVFKHALTQEIIYHSILSKNRQMLHEKIGRAMEKIFAKNLKEHCGTLARHFIEAGNHEKGAKYSELAAKKANTAASSKEAFEHSLNRVFCLESLPSSDANKKQIIDARTALAAYCINYAHIAEAYEAVAPIVDLTVQINYRKRLPIIYTTMGLYEITYEENFPKALKFLDEALKMSQETQNPISAYLTLWNLGMHFSWDCQFEKGEDCFNKCFEMSHAVGNFLGMSASKSILSTWNYLYQGKTELASETLEESLRVAEKSGDIYAKGLAYAGYGYLSYIKGSLTESEGNLLKGLNYLEKTNQIIFSAWTAVCLGQYYVEAKKFENAIGYFQKAQSILVENRNFFPSLINWLALSIAKAKVLIGQTDINLSDLFGYYKKNSVKIFKGWMARDIAEILLHIDTDHFAEVEEWIRKAIEAHAQNGMKWQLACDHAVYADFFCRKSDNKNARENFRKAIALFRDCAADGWAEKYEKELTLLS